MELISPYRCGWPTGMACVICHSGEGEVQLREKGVNSLIKASIQRNDLLHNTLTSNQNNFVHEKCRKTYTSSFNIQKAQQLDNENIDPCVLRSGDDVFEYKTHCLICTSKIDLGEIHKHPNRNVLPLHALPSLVHTLIVL